MKKIFSSLLIFGSFFITKGQNSFNTVSNEANIKGKFSMYTDVGDVEMSNKSIQMNLSNTYSFGQLQFGLNYENQTRRFNDIQESYLFSSFENSHSIGFSSTYIRTHNNNWNASLNLSPQFNSTFKGVLSGDDLILTWNVKLSKKWDTSILNRKRELIFGLQYDTLFGEPRLYPYVSYTNFINESWGYSLGFPSSNVSYTLNRHQNISLLVGPESNYTNNSEGISINGTTNYFNSKLEFSSLIIELNYSMRFDSNWTTSFGASYLPIAELRILDTNDAEIYSFESTELLCVKFRVKYKLN